MQSHEEYVGGPGEKEGKEHSEQREQQRTQEAEVWKRLSCVSTICVESRLLKGRWVWNDYLILEHRDLAGNESREAEGNRTYSTVRT